MFQCIRFEFISKCIRDGKSYWKLDCIRSRYAASARTQAHTPYAGPWHDDTLSTLNANRQIGRATSREREKSSEKMWLLFVVHIQRRCRHCCCRRQRRRRRQQEGENVRRIYAKQSISFVANVAGTLPFTGSFCAAQRTKLKIVFHFLLASAVARASSMPPLGGPFPEFNRLQRSSLCLPAFFPLCLCVCVQLHIPLSGPIGSDGNDEPCVLDWSNACVYGARHKRKCASRSKTLNTQMPQPDMDSMPTVRGHRTYTHTAHCFSCLQCYL